jgi:hypothetical protein
MGLAAVFAAGGVALAQPDPSGIDFVSIGAPGNPAYQSATNPLAFENGRGSVPYEFRIGRYEVTSGQWSQFFAAALNRPDPVPWVERPSVWGGSSRPMDPVGGVTWRTCAIYCNWLHNNKSLDRAAFLSGAYDVSTFGYDTNGRFTDQEAHSTGARFWIPTMDEWLKASHYDPNKQNPDGSTGGWWAYNNGTDVRPAAVHRRHGSGQRGVHAAGRRAVQHPAGGVRRGREPVGADGYGRGDEGIHRIRHCSGVWPDLQDRPWFRLGDVRGQCRSPGGWAGGC